MSGTTVATVTGESNTTMPAPVSAPWCRNEKGGTIQKQPPVTCFPELPRQQATDANASHCLGVYPLLYAVVKVKGVDKT